MSDYVDPWVRIPASLQTDLEKLAPILQAGSEAEKLGRELIANSERLMAAPRQEYKLVAYVIYAKGFKTFQSAFNLCLLGCGSDALSLCASLFENLVDLRYLGKAPVRNPRRYFQFEQVDKLIRVRRILRRKRLPKGMRNRYKQIKQHLDTPTVRKLEKYFPKKSRGWSQKTLVERARAVGLDLAYEVIYAILCAHKHTVPSAGAGFTVLDGPQGPRPVYEPNVKGVYDGVCQATEWFLVLSGEFKGIFQLDGASKIEDLRINLQQAAQRVLLEHPEQCD